MIFRDTDTAATEDGTLGRVDGGAPQQHAEGGGYNTPEEMDWLRMAQQSYDDSTSFWDSSLITQWDANERAFRNQHPSGSKYYSEGYRHRAKIFRPKTRSHIRQGEAALALALFSTTDIASITAVDESNEKSRISAELIKSLLQYRLSTPNPASAIPWFLTTIGAYQEASKYGIVTSYQGWVYQAVERTTFQQQVDDEGNPVVDEEGNPVADEIKHTIVTKDKPDCVLIPPENIRVDRGCDWRDPINSSPFVVWKFPMYIGDVRQKMKVPDTKTGQPKWITVADSELVKAKVRDVDPTRSQREGNREDSKRSDSKIEAFTLVWIHLNVMRHEGEDYVYYTVGREALLSKPVRLSEAYPYLPPGQRPFTMGQGLVEAHRAFPSGKPELIAPLQAATNEIANQRIDNVKLAMNKRYFVKRGKNVDLRQLTRSTPGGVTLTDDPEKDVKVDDTSDVTSSAYAEQDRLNLDIDEIAGNFSAGSVMSNRKLNETVGGMELLSGSANMVGGYDIRTYLETWLEPTLNQLVKMIQYYESDEKLVAIAGNKAQVFQKYGIDQITDEHLQGDLVVQINAGIDALDPMKRMQKLGMAAKMLGEVLGPAVQKFLKPEELIKEVMGYAGYRDGLRFFSFGDKDPVLAQAEETIKALKDELEKHQIKANAQVEAARLGATGRVLAEEVKKGSAIQVERMRTAGRMYENQQTHAQTLREMAIERMYEALAMMSESGNGEGASVQ